jgi:hypothetical protein
MTGLDPLKLPFLFESLSTVSRFINVLVHFLLGHVEKAMEK